MNFWEFLQGVAPVVCFFGFLTTAVVMGSLVKIRTRASRTLTIEEEKMLQDLWKGLEKVETRISNLETILIQRERK